MGVKGDILGVKGDILGVKRGHFGGEKGLSAPSPFLSDPPCSVHLMRQDLVVTKANSLVEASYRLNVSEQRVLALLVAQVQPDDEDFKPYRFKASELHALIESSNKDEHQRLKDLSRGLLRKTLQIQTDNGWLMLNWLSSARYFSGEGEIALRFDPELKPYMLELKERFTTYKLAYVVKLRSRYSVRLYELLKQYESVGERSIELSDLRQKLGLTDGEYGKWKDLRVRVVEPALRELPKKTDLAFSYTTRKKGRAVNWLDFKIWCPLAKSVSKARLKILKNEAAQCWLSCRGNCASTWERYSDKPHESCHWCSKFEQARVEDAGQMRLPIANNEASVERSPVETEPESVTPEEAEAAKQACLNGQFGDLFRQAATE